MAVVTPPTSIDRTGSSPADAGTALTAWTAGLPDGTTVDLGTDTRYRCDTSWVLNEKLGLTVKGADAVLFRTPGLSGQGAVVSVIGGRDLDFEVAAIVGGNAGWEASAHTDRESHHCLYLSGAVDACIYRTEFSYPWADFVYLGRKKVGPSGSDDSYVPCVNVWVTGCYGHHAGRQWVTAQGVRDCIVADNEFDQGKRSGLEMEGLVDAGNGVDGLLFAGNRCGYSRLNWIANAGSQQADNVTIEGNLLARNPTIYGKDGLGRRRRGWRIVDNRLMAPGEARSFPSPAKPPHHGSPSGCLFDLTGYDDLTVSGNGPFSVDANRAPSMVLAHLKDCVGPYVQGNDVREVVGSGSKEGQFVRTGVELRVT